MIEITDIDDIRISEFKNLKKNLNNINSFIADGEKVVLKLLNSDLEILKIFSKKEFILENIDLIYTKISNNNIFYADKQLLADIIGFRLHTGVMALAVSKEMTTLEKFSGNIVILNNIIDAENVGSIIRNCIGFGFLNIILDKQSAYLYLRRTVRVSMGAVFKINYLYTDNLIDIIKHLKQKKYTIISIENTYNSENLFDYTKQSNIVLIFGNESKGICTDILEMSDKILQIPITKSIDSLNVSNASAIALNYFYNLK
jgi:tRNA G18 (ribose-2'-O)-methylase SpoU